MDLDVVGVAFLSRSHEVRSPEPVQIVAPLQRADQVTAHADPAPVNAGQVPPRPAAPSADKNWTFDTGCERTRVGGCQSGRR